MSFSFLVLTVAPPVAGVLLGYLCGGRLSGFGAGRRLPDELRDTGFGVPAVGAPLGRRAGRALREVTVLDELVRGDGVDDAKRHHPHERRRAEPSPQRSHAGQV